MLRLLFWTWTSGVAVANDYVVVGALRNPLPDCVLTAPVPSLVVRDLLPRVLITRPDVDG